MKQTLLLGVGKMILLVHSLKISSQISIILWFFGPSPYNINIFEIKDIHRIKNLKKTCFYRKKYKKQNTFLTTMVATTATAAGCSNKTEKQARIDRCAYKTRAKLQRAQTPPRPRPGRVDMHHDPIYSVPHAVPNVPYSLAVANRSRSASYNRPSGRIRI